MIAQTLSVQSHSKIHRDTLLQIYNQFRPIRLGLRESTIYVQLDSEVRAQDFSRMIRNGAYQELKPEIFEILDSPANLEACFSKCTAVLASAGEIQAHFSRVESESMLKQDGDASILTQETSSLLENQRNGEWRIIQLVGEEEKTLLLTPIYEPSGKFEVEFDDEIYPLEASVRASNQMKMEQQSNTIEVMHLQSSSPERSKESVVEQLDSHLLSPEKRLDAPQSKVEVVIDSEQNSRVLNTYSLAILAIWVLWLII